jgi:hypothetical protein
MASKFLADIGPMIPVFQIAGMCPKIDSLQRRTLGDGSVDIAGQTGFKVIRIPFLTVYRLDFW